MKRQLALSLILMLITWLMTGISVDDEFYEDYNIFLKHRPSMQYYFSSPLGMQDMPVDYPTELRQKQAVYDEFVLEKHWSSGLDWLAVVLVFGTIFYMGFVVVKRMKQ